MSMPRLKSCPVCGCRKLRGVRGGRYATRRGGRAVEVRNVDYQECAECGERYFDDATLERIEHARQPRRRAATG